MNIGDLVEAKSGTQGWVKGVIVDFADIFIQGPRSIMTKGQQGYMVRFTEGKHTGETIKLPDNYLRKVSSGQLPQRGSGGSGLCPICGKKSSSKILTCGRRSCIEEAYKRNLL